jgi:hypothetical protein
MPQTEPYLSVVVTARNDDHGGNLLGRMQIFTTGWIEQARRFGFPSELIIVEWNPPLDRPRLEEVLRWPKDFGPCNVRFIEVPSALHRRYHHAEAMPLYQMIAKNVGIRRARGRFVLATNIDILFSDDLVAFLAEQQLDAGRMYRIDRHDVMSDVPPDACLQDQLEYCRTHLLRVNAREGTFPLTPDGRRALAKEDIATEDGGVRFGSGWFPVERYQDREVFRWVDNDAEIELQFLPEPCALQMELEPGPGMGQRAMTLDVLERDRMIMSVAVKYRSLLSIPSSLLGWRQGQLRLRVNGGGDRVPHDPRILNLRVFSCRVVRTRSTRQGIAPVTSGPWRVRKRVVGAWHGFQALLNRLATSDYFMNATIVVPPMIKRMAAFYVGWGGFTGMILNWGGYLLGRVGLRPRVPLRWVKPSIVREIAAPATVAHLHTNACGDFTLAARERWLDLRGYPEFDMYSMNIDSVFCYAAHHGGAAEEVLQDPMRIYHIEHGAGSGWTPEGEAKLYARLAAKGIGWVSYRDFVTWAAEMRKLGCPMIFNHDNWGLGEFELKESRPIPAQTAATLQPTVRRAADSE